VSKIIKAIFFDLDGTLLTSEKMIRKNTTELIKKCKEKGIKIFIATARPPTIDVALNFNEEEKSLFHDGVFYDGACILVNKKKKYLTLDDELVFSAIDIISKHENINIAVQLEKELHSFKYDLDDDEYKYWGVNKKDTVPFDNLKDYSDEIVKLLAFGNNLVDLKDEIEYELKDRVNIFIDDNEDMIQVVNNKADKRFGIENILDYEGIKSDNIAVFGDGSNDMEMLKNFKNSIAMGNATQEVMDCAKHVTLSNDRDGISYALKNLLFLV
jgi:Cof subfamily protein (haloacid dehalogenase superfamily)